MRALIAARKSTTVRKDAEGDKAERRREGHSLHTQDEHTRAFCERLGWDVKGVAKDTISGRVAPIDRKELGAWLAKPHLFDVVVAFKSDRLSRGKDTDWSRIETWAADNGKTLVIVDSGTGIRYPSRDDSDFWQWTAMKRQAGREWEEIRERSLRSQAALVDSGAVVSRPPYGYRVAGDKYAKRLEVIPEKRDTVLELFANITAGASLRQTAALLRERTGEQWDDNKVFRMVSNWTYAGRVEREGQHYATCEPIITPAELTAAQKAMRSRNKNPGGKPSPVPALMVMICGPCGGKMYRHREKYYCRACSFAVPVTQADHTVKLTLARSTEKEKRTRVIPGRNHDDEIESVKRDRLQALAREDIDAVVALSAELRRLEALPAEPETVIEEETGRMVGEVYAAMDRETLRAKLREWTIVALPDRIKLVAPWKDPETR